MDRRKIIEKDKWKENGRKERKIKKARMSRVVIVGERATLARYVCVPPLLGLVFSSKVVGPPLFGLLFFRVGPPFGTCDFFSAS